MKRRVLALMLIVVLTFTLSGCNSKKAESEGTIEDTSVITEKIIASFDELTEIPRPTYYEKEVSDFLKNWAENQGLEVVQDEANNIIADVPATEGMEDKPLVVLQGHMDMVFAQKDGLYLDPETTKITMLNDGTYLTSDGSTSLGADDGIGVAIMRLIAEGEMAHGPLRLIITTDEEQTSTGVRDIDSKYVENVKYMINLDDEIEGEIVISSAAGVTVDFLGDNNSEKPIGDTGVEISLTGLTGGHSGDEIDKNRLNGIIAMGEILDDLREKNIAYQLAEFKGGNASNAIPTGSTAVICIDEKDYDDLTTAINESFEAFKKQYQETDPDMNIAIIECEKPSLVISESNLESILTLTGKIINGVYSMSDIIDGLVESSSNLGIINVDPEKARIVAMLRSSDPEMEKEITDNFIMLANECNFDILPNSSTRAWPVKEDNILQKIAEDSYRDIFGRELNVVAIHAGLECGTFATYNPDMDIISMGPTVTSPHSIQESVEIESIGKVWVFLEEILKRVE